MRKIRSMKEEDRLYDFQYEEIRRMCGKKRADRANYGWMVDYYKISTKVYGPPQTIIITSYFVGNRIEHYYRSY